MKKRCTNSSCRKSFVANSICPYCAKKYPRISTAEIIRAEKSTSSYVDIILTAHGPSRIKVVLALGRILNIDLREAKRYTDSHPIPIALNIPVSQAKEMAHVLEEAGATTNIIPHSARI